MPEPEVHIGCQKGQSFEQIVEVVAIKRGFHKENPTFARKPNLRTAHSTGGHPQVQADGRLAAHLRETPAHMLEEDAEPNEDLAGNDFTYSHDTTTAFQELL